MIDLTSIGYNKRKTILLQTMPKSRRMCNFEVRGICDFTK